MPGMQGATGSEWVRIGGMLMVGLFMANLDRINLSVALPAVADELGLAGAQFPPCRVGR